MLNRITQVGLSVVIAIFTLVGTVSAEGKGITVLSPKEYQVFQRQDRYDGFILVSGRVNADCNKLEARITGKSLKGDLAGKWQVIALVAKTRSFTTRIPVVPGGWYKVEFRAVKGRAVVAQAVVEKVGVGEVFVGAGQSNSTSCGQYKTSTITGMVSSFNGTAWRMADDPQWGANDDKQGGSFWPSFGDAMYKRYHVPVGVAVTGRGGTGVDWWQPDATEETYKWMLYKFMMTRIYQLGPQGFRAVLWHQGEHDAKMPTDEYVTKLTTIIEQSKADAGWSFPWFVAQASYQKAQNPSYPRVRAAQQKLWELGIALEGPDTDTLTGDMRDKNGTGVHLSPKGLKAHGEMWVEKVGVYLDSVLGPE